MIVKKYVGYSQDLPEDFKQIYGYAYTVEVAQPSVMKVSGHIDCHHRGVSGTADKAVMVALQLKHNGSWIDGSKTGLNIVGTEQHYCSLLVHAVLELDPGTHEFTVWMRSASTAAPGVDGLAEVKSTYEEVVYDLANQ